MGQTPATCHLDQTRLPAKHEKHAKAFSVDGERVVSRSNDDITTRCSIASSSPDCC